MEKPPAFIPDLIRMLDNVLTYLSRTHQEQLEKAKFSAYEGEKYWTWSNGISCISTEEQCSF